MYTAYCTSDAILSTLRCALCQESIRRVLLLHLLTLSPVETEVHDVPRFKLTHCSGNGGHGRPFIYAILREEMAGIRKGEVGLDAKWGSGGFI